MFITFIKYSQVKMQKQGQNIKIQHGFICFHFCQLNSLTRECSLFGSDLSKLRSWTYSSSQAVCGCTAASLLNFKARGRKSPSLGKNEGKRERHIRPFSFCYLSLFFQHRLTHWAEGGRDTNLYLPVISGVMCWTMGHFFFNSNKKKHFKFVELTWVVNQRK